MTIADYSYAKDATGNITAIDDLTDSTRNRSFGYDDLNRLTTANTGTGLWGGGTFAYDNMGNLLSSSVGDWNQQFTYVGTTSKIAGVTEHGFDSTVDYDAAGNKLSSSHPTRPPNGLVALNPSTYTNVARTYSCRNLMAVVSTSSYIPGTCPPPNRCQPLGHYQTVEYDYVYDGRGIRVHESSSNGDGSDYTYTPDLQLHRIRYADDSDSTAEFVRFNGYPVAQLWSSLSAPVNPVPGDMPLYTFTDHLGTPLLQTDTDGTIVWRAEHEPYGRVYQVTEGDEYQQPLRFPGQDIASQARTGAEESYNIFRWYRAGWGRYTQADPIGFKGGDTNLFAYAGDEPTSFSDPLGLAPIWNPFAVYRDFRDRRARAQREFRGQNQMRHCVFSCRMALEYGPDLTRLAGVVNEEQGFYMHDLPMLGSRLRGQTPWAFEFQDLWNNEIGFACARYVGAHTKCSTCESCCRDAIFGNRSQDTPPPQMSPTPFGPCATVDGRIVCAGTGI